LNINIVIQSFCFLVTNLLIKLFILMKNLSF